MNKQTMLAALFAGIAAFLVGWFILGILMLNYYTISMVQGIELVKNPPDAWAIAIANIAWGILYAVIFKRANISAAQKRFSTGLTLALLMVLGFNLFMYVQMNLYGTKMLAIDVILNALLGGITGTLLGWRFGKPARN